MRPVVRKEAESVVYYIEIYKKKIEFTYSSYHIIISHYLDLNVGCRYIIILYVLRPRKHICVAQYNLELKTDS